MFDAKLKRVFSVDRKDRRDDIYHCENDTPMFSHQGTETENRFQYFYLQAEYADRYRSNSGTPRRLLHVSIDDTVGFLHVE